MDKNVLLITEFVESPNSMNDVMQFGKCVRRN